MYIRTLNVKHRLLKIKILDKYHDEFHRALELSNIKNIVEYESFGDRLTTSESQKH
jgi:hypothetical protein